MSREFGICGEIVISSSGGGAGLIMPTVITGQTNDLYIKTVSAFPDSSNAAFWTDIDISHTDLGYESVKLAAAANQLEQTILNISGAGILTHVVAPSLNSSGTMIIRITADGTTTVYTSPTITTDARLCLGNFKGYRATGTAGNGLGLGSSTDFGFALTRTSLHMPQPPVSLMDRLMGIKFESTCIVTIQAQGSNVTASANKLNACANHTNFIPEGL